MGWGGDVGGNLGWDELLWVGGANSGWDGLLGNGRSFGESRCGTWESGGDVWWMLMG